MIQFFRQLVNTDSFPARWNCGIWTPAHGWLHVCSDIATFLAYLTIPFVILYYLRKRRGIRFPAIYYWFAAFIFSCGTVHLIEAVIFWHPIYRLSGLFKFITALVSWGTVGAIIHAAPRAVSMRTAEELEYEIDERKRVEVVLRESDLRYRSLVDSISDMVQSVGPDGKLLFANPAWFKTLGYQTEDLGNLTLWDVIDPEDHSYCRRTIDDLAAGVEIGAVDVKFIANGGKQVPVEGRASAGFVEGELSATHWFFQDLSERKAAEEKLLQSARLSAIGQAMTGLVHESRNALARSQAGLKLLSRDVEGSKQSLRLIDEVLEAQQDVQHLFEEVRQYAVPPKLRLASIRLNEVVDAAWDQLNEERRGRIATISQHFSDVDVTCQLDEVSIRNVFRNLFENSLAASSEPVRILVRYRRIEYFGASGLEIRIADQGTEFDTADQQQWFEPFFTTKTEGTGLGLAISKQTIERHQGTIELNPTCRSGVEFIIRLPQSSS